MTRSLTIRPALTLAFVLSAGVAYAQAIRIGVNEPLTGPFAASGTYVVNGAKIAVDEINAKGGVLGKTLELVIEDNKSNPTEAAAVAEKLITSDKTPVMMGAWGSSLTLAVMPKLADYETAMLVETSSSGKITTSGNPFVFRISPPSALEAESFAPLVEKLGLKKVDFLAINNDWGRGAAADFTKMLKAKGVTVGLVETMDQGQVRFRGTSLQGLQPHEIVRLGLSRTFQRTSVFPDDTVFDNVMIGLHRQGRSRLIDTLLGRDRAHEAQLRERARELLDWVGLSGRAQDKAGSLAYGEQRLVGVALALATEPAMLLLDEPVSGMNASETQVFVRLIRSIRDRGVTLLLVEHDMPMVMEVSDRIVVLNYGRLIAEGPPAAIRADPAVIEAYLGQGSAAREAAQAVRETSDA